MADGLASSDIVPAFRADLKIGAPVHGPGENTVVVTDPDNDKSMILRGFELSLARMLDGERTAGAVVDAANAIGLPITLDALGRFLKRLRAKGFLADPAKPRPGSTSWPGRREWAEDKRERYKAALREARTGQLDSARQHLEELKRDQFENTDVQDLHKWVDERIRADGEGKALPKFAEIFSQVEHSWFEEGERVSEQNEQAPAPVIANEPVEEAPPRRLPWKVIAVAVVLAIAAAVLLVPFPSSTTGTYELASRGTVAVTSPRAGNVGVVQVFEGVWVEKGATLFTYDASEAQQKLAAAEHDLAELEPKLAELETTVNAPTKLRDDAKAAVDAAEGELADAKTKNDNAAITAAQQKIRTAKAGVKTAEAAAVKAKPASDAAVPERDELKAKVDAATAERDAQKPLTELPPVTAPAAGFVTGLALKIGDPLQANAAVCRVEDAKVLVVTMHADAPIAPGQTASLVIDGKEQPVRIERADGKTAWGSLDNPNNHIHAGTHGDVTIDTGDRSLLSRLF